MAFLGGAECSTAGNPLTQFTKQFHDDNTLQRDRLVGRGPGGLEEGMRSKGASNAPDQALNEFLNPATQPFEMDQMRSALPRFQQASQRSGSPGWAAEFEPGEQARMEGAFQGPGLGEMKSNRFSPAEFARFQQSRQNSTPRTSSPIAQNPSYMNGFHRPMGLGYMGAMNTGVAMGMPSYASSFQAPQQQESGDKGKSRMVELDDSNWEAQFAAMETDKQSTISDEAAAAMESELNDMDRSVQTSNDHFEAVWRGIQAEHATNRDVLENFDVDRYMSGDTRDLYDDFDQLPLPGDSLSRNAFPEGTYQFETHNAFTTHADPFAEGLSILQNNGNLSLAALAFEAAVLQSPTHATAWQLLGHTQAQNEKETPAIRALERAVELDPSNTDALMSLAVSYTNESYDALAYRTLERWLSVKYPSIIPPSEIPPNATDHIGFTERANLHSRITNLFIRAAQLSPSGPHLDPDVQVGLGVLFYAAEEHSKAVDCFNAALASTEQGSTTNPQEIHLLWNRLGATLANSGRSEDAIAAYERALTLNPNFVRARYNLGVSCINIGCYPEAAQHLLEALSLHRILEDQGAEKGKGLGMSEEEVERVVRSNESGNLYETLRRALGGMGRRDLVDRVGSGMSVTDMRAALGF
ncbi:MAG: hypothetical protein Q9160_002492 [Pyrenula sp. 1 TL-2023]